MSMSFSQGQSGKATWLSSVLTSMQMGPTGGALCPNGELRFRSMSTVSWLAMTSVMWMEHVTCRWANIFCLAFVLQTEHFPFLWMLELLYNSAVQSPAMHWVVILTGFRLSASRKCTYGARGSVVGSGTSRKIASSSPDDSAGFFNLPNPSGRSRPWGSLNL
jgi:hypothetical protein